MTLIELLIATALTGLLLLGATRLIDGVADGARRAQLDGAASTTSALGRRTLRLLIRNARALQDSVTAFTGDGRAAEFISLCDVSRGWVERCQVRISLEPRRDSTVIVAAFDDRTLELHGGDASLGIRYLEERGGAWRSEWRSSTTLPVALAFADSRDTLVVPVGSAP